jgi:hypothetical protein
VEENIKRWRWHKQRKIEGIEKKKCIEEERNEGRGYGRRDRRINVQKEVLKTVHIVLNWHEFICGRLPKLCSCCCCCGGGGGKICDIQVLWVVETWQVSSLTNSWH